MTTKTETRHAGGFIVSEANGTRSREAITVLSGQTLLTGAVLALLAIGAVPATGTANGGNTGNGTLTGVAAGAAVKVGTYIVVIDAAAANAGSFRVEDPDGAVIGHGTVGVAFSDAQIGFTVNDGSTDFAVGDSFTIVVPAGSGKYRALNPAGLDGSQNAAAVLFDAVDAAAGDKPGVAVVRHAEVNGEELEWPAGITSDQKTAAIKRLAAVAGIVVR